MGLFGSKENRKPTKIHYDPEIQTAAVRQSICTGEMTVGFIDKGTGKFHEYMLAKSRKDVEEFCRRIGIPPESIQTIY